jgi:hypothetical protein
VAQRSELARSRHRRRDGGGDGQGRRRWYIENGEMSIAPSKPLAPVKGTGRARAGTASARITGEIWQRSTARKLSFQVIDWFRRNLALGSCVTQELKSAPSAVRRACREGLEPAV